MKKKAVKKKQRKQEPLFVTKYKKLHTKPALRGNDWCRQLRHLKRSGVIISKGYGKLTKEELEAARRVIRSKSNKRGRLLLRVQPSLFLTKKPAQVRMGKGKGRISSYVAFVRPGKILFELQGLRKQRSCECLLSGSKKLSLSVSVKYISDLYR